MLNQDRPRRGLRLTHAGANQLVTPFPGFVVVGMAVALCLCVGDLVGRAVMLLAILCGLAAGPLRRSARMRPGFHMAAKPLLRVGVALLGAKISLLTITAIGQATLALVIACPIVTLGIGYALSRWPNLDGNFVLLLAGATAICGASATLAIASVLPDSPQKASGQASQSSS